RFKWKLSCTYLGDSLIIEFHYDAGRFAPKDIQRLAREFSTLVEGALRTPEAPISALPILSAIERQQLLVEFNTTEMPFDNNQCIHYWFEEQVERTPDRTAVVFEEESLTYAELNARANQLAHYLQKLGVGPEVLVALCVERSLDLVVGVLGILK